MSALDRLKDCVGPKGFSEDPSEIAPHLHEWRSTYQGRTPLLLKPNTTEQVSHILAICHETDTKIVPQGGNTGLVGGQIPFGGEVLLSLSRLNRIRALEGGHLVAEAGVVLAAVHSATDDAGMLFPLSLASEGSCTIGGNLSTNAGGVNVLRYGMARDLVLGLEVVLADGGVLDLLRALRKDNTGYDLKQLFIGAEGTLGVITAASLKLFPKPSEIVTALVAVPSPDAAVALLTRLQAASGGLLSAYELISRMGLDLVLAHIPQATDPQSMPSPWYVLLEATSGAKFNLHDVVEEALSDALSDGLASDATIASSGAQRATFWRLRESMSEAQKKEGASLKHDVSVPIAAIPEFLESATAAVLRVVPGTRPVSFGHIGDGNIHFNFSFPLGSDGAVFLERRAEIARIVHDIVAQFHGSFSAEHGVGVMKRDELLRYKSETEIDVMRALKRTLDPKNILNPGKIFEVP